MSTPTQGSPTDGLAVGVSRREAHVQAAGVIWAAATAARDGEPDLAPASESRALIEAALARPRSALVVLLDRAARVLAFATAEQCPEDEARAHVGYVAVAPEVWGRGLGGALMRALPQRLRGLGYERARLWVYVDNARAVSLYESAGWSAKGEATIHPRSRKRGRYYELGL